MTHPTVRRAGLLVACLSSLFIGHASASDLPDSRIPDGAFRVSGMVFVKTWNNVRERVSGWVSFRDSTVHLDMSEGAACDGKLMVMDREFKGTMKCSDGREVAFRYSADGQHGLTFSAWGTIGDMKIGFEMVR